MLAELPAGHPLDIAGHGDHGETLDDEIARRGLGDRVRVHGYVDEQTKADLYRQAWLHVTASTSEGWSLTVMEAALCGTPSAALAIGGLRESIVDGADGHPAADPADLRRSVRELLEDHELRTRLGEAARARAQTFTWDRTAATTLAVVQQQVAPARAQPGRLDRSGEATTAGASTFEDVLRLIDGRRAAGSQRRRHAACGMPRRRARRAAGSSRSARFAAAP